MMEMPNTEPFPGETLIADGWIYRDLPRLTQEAFNQFLNILGEENARFLTFARYPDKSVRGQFLMSPAGMERLKAHSAASKVANNRTGEASAPLDIVPIKSSDQGTVAVSSADRGDSMSVKTYDQKSYQLAADFLEDEPCRDDPGLFDAHCHSLALAIQQAIEDWFDTPDTSVTSTHQATPE